MMNYAIILGALKNYQ